MSQDLREYQQRGLISELFAKLSIFQSLIATARVPTIVRALSKSASLFSRPESSRESEARRAKPFLFRLLEDRVDSIDARLLLEEVVREAEPLPFAVSVVLSCHRWSGALSLRINEPAYLAALRRIAAKRLFTHYVQDDRNIFIELPESEWRFVLYQWGTDWMTESGENREIVQGYVMNLIDREPEYLGRLLHSFMQRGPLAEEEAFSFKEFSQVYDPEAIGDRLDRYGDRALTNPEERKAAELFRRQYQTNVSQRESTE